MKVSRYTFFVKYGNRNFLYNTLSNALTEVDEELFNYLKKLKMSHDDLGKSINNDLIETLKSGKYITENDEDEFLIYKSIIQSLRSEKQHLIMTIAPTMDCCFKCHYCFEKSKQPTYMSEDVMKGITKYIGAIDNIKGLNLTWFGGEPLMAVKKMHSLYKQLNISNKSVDSSIITNGFLLNDSTIDILKTINVSTVQVTLDGTESSHNSRKKLSGNSHVNVFRKTINNIIKLSNEEFAKINIRVNIDNHNKQEFLPLYEYLAKEIPNFGKNVFVSPAFIADSPTKGCDKNEICVLSRKQISDFVVRLQKKHQFYHPLLYPSNILYECPVRNDNSWVICPDGSLFKCWEVVGIEDFKVGHLDENGEIVVTNESLLFQYMEGADPLSDKNCINCKTYPICGGGCVHARIMKKYHKAKVNPCAYAKNYLEKFLSAYYDIQAH